MKLADEKDYRDHLADQIVYVIDQPWGVNISEVTVRASGDAYIL